MNSLEKSNCEMDEDIGMKKMGGKSYPWTK